MKKLKLLMAFCALLLGWSNASARTDVTSTYLTDAALENEGTKWALVSNGGNHAWDGTNKYHESWHNTFTITQTTAALPAGYYQLSIQAAVEGGTSTTISLQATSGSNTSVAAYPKYSTASSYSDMAAWWAADASHTGNRDLNRIFTTVYVEEGQTLTATFKQTDGGQWFVYGQMQLHKLTDEEGRMAQYFEAAYNSQTNLDMAAGRFKQRFEYYKGDDVSTLTGKTLTKTISSLPNGKYNVTLNGGASYAKNGGVSGGGAGDDKTVFFANDVSTNVTVVERTNIGNEEFTDYSVSNVSVADGNLEIGFNNKTSGANWFVGSVKYIEYLGGCVGADADALPAGGAMEADKWYYFDIVVAGDNYNATATDLSKIICTDNANTLSTADAGNVTLYETDNDLAAKRYYVKSSIANKLVVEAASYSYDVGAPTLSTADGGYTQSSTFTVTFPSASTNDPSAEPAFVDESTATVNGNSVALSAVTNGFSLDLGSLTAGTDYVISIPAGVYGYAGESMNSIISLTIHTPEVFDGVYYLYDATNKLFLGRGANYGCRAVADKYGVAMNVATNASGISTFTFVDGGNNKLFDANEGNLYTDNTTYPNFAFEATTGGCYVVNKNTTASSTFDGKLYIDGSNVIVSTTNSTVWSLLTDAERDAIVDAYPTDNINTVITAAGISTSAAEFESFLATNYIATDKTDLIGTAKFTGSVGDWTWTQVKAQDKQPAYGTDFAELWNATGTYSQTVDKAGLPAGIYKVTVDGYERRATVDISNSLGAADYNLVSSYLAANDEQVRLTDWYNTSKPGNTGDAVTAFNNGEATNELYIYLDGNTDLDIKLVKPNYVWDCWTIFNNFTLTYYQPSVSKTITAAGWATYCSPYALDLEHATGLTDAYIVTGATGTTLNTTSVKGGTVPPNTGILIKAPEGTVTIPVVESSTTNVGANKLVGVTSNTPIAAEAGYVLMNETAGVGFYKNANAFTVGANTAYLPANFAAGAARSAYFFGGNITAVDNVEAAAEAKAKEGKFIENGKLVIVKNGVKFNAAGAQVK